MSVASRFFSAVASDLTAAVDAEPGIQIQRRVGRNKAIQVEHVPIVPKIGAALWRRLSGERIGIAGQPNHLFLVVDAAHTAG